MKRLKQKLLLLIKLLSGQQESSEQAGAVPRPESRQLIQLDYTQFSYGIPWNNTHSHSHTHTHTHDLDIELVAPSNQLISSLGSPLVVYLRMGCDMRTVPPPLSLPTRPPATKLSGHRGMFGNNSFIKTSHTHTHQFIFMPAKWPVRMHWAPFLCNTVN